MGQSAILKMAGRPTIDLYAGPPARAGSSAIYENRLFQHLELENRYGN